MAELKCTIMQPVWCHQKSMDSGEAFGNGNMYREGVGRGSSGFGEVGAKVNKVKNAILRSEITLKTGQCHLNIVLWR